MEQTTSRWFFIFLAMTLISIFMFPARAHADSSWLKYFRKDSLLNTYKTCYAVLDETIWLGTSSEGIKVYDGKNTLNYTNKNTRTTPAINDGLASDYVTCIAIDEKRGLVWVGTNAGLSCCNLEGKEWTTYKAGKACLPNDLIRDIAIDSSGNVWVGTPSGLAYYDGETWKVFNDSNGLKQPSIHAIKIKNDVVWVGTISGSVSRYKDGEWKTILSY